MCVIIDLLMVNW